MPYSTIFQTFGTIIGDMSVSRSDPPHLWFHGGTLVLETLDRTTKVHPAFRWVKAKWRCPALCYPQLIPWLRERGIQDRVPRWEHPRYLF